MARFSFEVTRILIARVINYISCKHIDGLDIIGFHRELGQLYISTTRTKLLEAISIRKFSKPMQMRSEIPLSFKLIVQAGVSIELVDGDTTNINKEIIIQLLKLLKRS